MAIAGLLAAAVVPATVLAVEVAPVQLTFIKDLCPTYSVVPANKNPTNFDETGGHGGVLDTTYQTNLVNPATDEPASCQRAAGWGFQLSTVADPTGTIYTTGSDGSVTIDLTGPQIAAVQSSTFDSRLNVSEVMQPGVATFGALRCGNDILNGDNLEFLFRVSPTITHLYCIAYNVPVPPIIIPCTPANNCFFNTPPPSPTPSPVPTPTSTPVATATPAPTATATPQGSVEGATGRPRITPPATSTLGSGGGSTESNLPIVIVALISLGSTLALLTPRRRSSRRARRQP
ncbi:MAG: hypothetical protein ACYDAK_11985 [Candidatus Limnocylindrales bacterium]